MRKIVYLLGAGASANAIPVVKSMNLRIKMLRGIFERINNKLNERSTYKIRDCEFDNRNFSNLLNGIRKIVDQINEHYSIDTYAKKLYLTGDEDYNKLKHFINLYILFEQAKLNTLEEMFGFNYKYF